MGASKRAYVGIGSNLGDSIDIVHAAFEALKALPETIWVGASSLYCTAPVGPQQPHYINAVAAIDTRLAPLTLLDHLQAIEAQHHRQRTQRWGPRTLDLDILLYGDDTYDHPRLTIPHPEMQHRDFVQEPLAELQQNER